MKFSMVCYCASDRANHQHTVYTVSSVAHDSVHVYLFCPEIKHKFRLRCFFSSTGGNRSGSVNKVTVIGSGDLGVATVLSIMAKVIVIYLSVQNQNQNWIYCQVGLHLPGFFSGV